MKHEHLKSECCVRIGTYQSWSLAGHLPGMCRTLHSLTKKKIKIKLHVQMVSAPKGFGFKTILRSRIGQHDIICWLNKTWKEAFSERAT